MAADAKVKITMVGLKQAKEGFRFLHEGPSKECEGCRLFQVCMMNLEPKRVYQVVEVLEKVFPCPFHEEGARVVKVVEPDLQVAIDRRYVFPQGIITFIPQDCDEGNCEHYPHCVPHGLTAGDKGKIVAIIGPLQCHSERSLVLVTLRRMGEEPSRSSL